ncbi:MAG: UbiA prenyltransferase family protein, partial [Chloroflexota bacterium]|nr:UbiA prenyltransferase family protein [Chloroflexota bacterium]
KNAVVLAGVVFSGQAGEAGQLVQAIVAVVAFCMASSATYAFNDWHDRAEDRLHPIKYQRPVASGAIAPQIALAFGGALLIAAYLIALAISADLAAIILAYALLMLAYTLWFRRIAILDVLTIALGFVLRALAGAVAVSVPLSVWLFVCTLLLALMLGLGKRRHELRMLGGRTERRRPSLAGYARFDLDRLMLAIAILTAGTYALYALAVPTYGRDLAMFVTVPFVVLAIARYLFLVFRHNLGGAPEMLLVRDRPLFLSIVAWSVATTIVLAS